MAFFSAWDYRHYSLVQAELENTCYDRLVRLMENGDLPTPDNTSHKEEEESSGMKPKFSRLNKQEHKTYLRLLQKYNNKVLPTPSPEERKEIETLASLQRKVVQEQKEFTTIFQSLPDVHDRYKSISSQACCFAEEHLEASLQRTLCYPRHYREHCNLHLTDGAAIPQFEANVLQMGKCARLVRPNLSNHCQVALDHDRLIRRFPPLDISSGYHPSIGPVSRDDIGLKLALKHGAGILLELGVLATLLDCHTAESQWDLPVVVRKDKTSEQTVACIDECILPKCLSPRNKNQLYYNYAARLRLTHINVGRNREKKDGDETPAVVRSARPRGRPKKTESLRKDAPASQDDDIFGDAEDLETFGTVAGRKSETCASSETKEKVLLEGNREYDGTVKEDPIAEPDSPEPPREKGETVDDDRLERIPKTCSATRSPEKNGQSPSSGDTLPEPDGAAHGTSSRPPTGSVCTCPTRMATRRTKQQCTHCSTKHDDVLTQPREPADDASVDSEDQPLVIDEADCEGTPVAEIASPDSTADRCGGADRSKPGIPRITLTEVDEVKGGRHCDDTQREKRDGAGGTFEALPVDSDEAGNEQESSASDVHESEDVETAMQGDGCLETDSPESPTPDVTNIEDDDGCRNIEQAGMEAVADTMESSGGTGAPPSVVMEAGNGENATGCAPFPEVENVFYNLWKLGSVRVLLRHQAHALTAATKETWSIFPKLEYNAHFGAETFTEAELMKQMCYLIMIPNSHLLRVRINALSSSILCMEELSCTEFVSLAKNFSPDKLFGKAAYILEQLAVLQPGHYILSHDCGEDNVKVLKCTEENKRGTFDLHCIAQQRAASAEDPTAPARVVPLDPEVILPNAYSSGQIPLTFPPKDPKRPALLVPKKCAKRFKGRKLQQHDTKDSVVGGTST